MSQGIPTAHVPTLKSLEIHCTYRCNLRCAHCSNLIQQAPSLETMTGDRIQEILDESTGLGWPWERMVLHGGEPTLHPLFEDVCRRMAEYRDRSNPSCKVYLCTNGYGNRVSQGIQIAKKYGIIEANSNKGQYKEPNFPDSHIPLSVSPIDLGEDYHLGCFQSSQCGIAVTNQGYYECSPAAAAHRVFGYDPIATRLADLTVEKLIAGFAKHCGHCGYARIHKLEGDKEAPVGSPERTAFYRSLDALANPRAPHTKTWLQAEAAYKEKQRT